MLGVTELGIVCRCLQGHEALTCFFEPASARLAFSSRLLNSVPVRSRVRWTTTSLACDPCTEQHTHLCCRVHRARSRSPADSLRMADEESEGTEGNRRDKTSLATIAPPRARNPPAASEKRCCEMFPPDAMNTLISNRQRLASFPCAPHSDRSCASRRSHFVSVTLLTWVVCS